MTALYTPEQNAVPKRENRTIIESVRSMLHAMSIPQEFWAEVISIPVYTLNIVGTRTLDNFTPLQAWCGRRPDVSHFRISGSPAYMHIPKTLRTKLDAKGKLCMFIGYCTESKAYRLWDFQGRRVVISRDVLFNEDDFSTISITRCILFGFSIPPSVGLFPQQEVMESAVREPQVATVLLQHEALEERITAVAGIPLQQEAVDVTQQEAVGDGQLQTTDILRPVPEITSSMHTQQFDVGIEAPVSVSVNSEHFSLNDDDIVRDLGQPYVIYAANRTRCPPNHFGEWAQIKYTHPSFLGATESFEDLPIEPESYDQAMSSLEQIEWQKAMAEEYDSLMKNHTWILADRPPWRKAVKSKWVYKVKTTVDGTLQQYKCAFGGKRPFSKAWN